MPIITATDLSTNIYPEIINEITRGDNTIVNHAIAAAIQEAKLYLSRYDLTKLFGTDSAPATFTDELLNNIIKDISCWRIVKLGNPGLDLEIYKANYENAITILQKINKGDLEPKDWPYADLTTGNIAEGDSIKWTSNIKRNNYY